MRLCAPSTSIFMRVVWSCKYAGACGKIQLNIYGMVARLDERRRRKGKAFHKILSSAIIKNEHTQMNENFRNAALHQRQEICGCSHQAAGCFILTQNKNDYFELLRWICRFIYVDNNRRSVQLRSFCLFVFLETFSEFKNDEAKN